MTRTYITIATFGAMTLFGCQQQQQPQEEFFTADTPLTTQIIDAQSARGARSDATLYMVHFNGGQLSPVGRDKLTLMLADDSTPLPLVVYVAVPADAQAAARQQAIKSFLADAGLPPDQVTLESGANPRTMHSIAPDLARMAKTESTGQSQTGQSGTSQSPSSSAQPASK